MQFTHCIYNCLSALSQDVPFEAVVCQPMMFCHVDDNLLTCQAADVVEINGFFPTS